MSISIRNRLAGAIEKIVSDKVISRSYHPNRGRNRDFDYYNGSVERMNLREGDNVFAVMKATSVSVEKK